MTTAGSTQGRQVFMAANCRCQRARADVALIDFQGPYGAVITWRWRVVSESGA